MKYLPYPETIPRGSIFGSTPRPGEWTATPAASLTTGGTTDGFMLLGLIWLPDNLPIDGLSFEVTTAGSLGASTVRGVLYEDNGAGFPGLLVIDTGPIDAGTAAMKNVTGLPTYITGGGLFHIGILPQGAPAIAPVLRFVGTPSWQAITPTPVSSTLSGSFLRLTGLGAGAPPNNPAVTRNQGSSPFMRVKRAA